MEFSMRRVKGLLKKEFRDFSKNTNVLFMCLLPIVFCFIYSKILGGSSSQHMPKFVILNLCLGMNLTLVCSFVIAMLIAEEKEKNTLRTLMLSGISPLEFLMGKAMITLFVTVVINIGLFFIAGIDVQYLGKYILISTLVCLSMIELGAVIGLLSPNQMATGTVGMPILMIFYIVPMFSGVNNVIKSIARLLPTYNLNVLLSKLLSGKVINTNVTFNLGVILVWIIIAAGIFQYVYNKKGIE